MILLISAAFMVVAGIYAGQQGLALAKINRSLRGVVKEMEASRPFSNRFEEVARTLAFALKGLYDDQVDYLKLNNLGGMDNHWMRAARIALADYARETGGDAK